MRPPASRVRSIKLADELDAATLYAGALYQYLDATQQFGMLFATAPAVAKQSRLRKALQKTSADLHGSQQDHSTAQLFLERAEAGLTRSPGAAGWITVETIVEQVLPPTSRCCKRLRLPSLERRLELP